MGPPWLGLLHYNLHEREGKRVSSPDLKKENQPAPPSPHPRGAQGQRLTALQTAGAHRVICCHNVMFSLAWFPLLLALGQSLTRMEIIGTMWSERRKCDPYEQVPT